MSFRGRLLYPPLFAAALVIGVAGGNPGQYRASDFFIVLGTAAVVAALFLAIAVLAARVAARSEQSLQLAAPLAMLAVAWFFFYVPAQNALAAVTWRFSRDGVLLPLGGAATVVVVTWLVRQRGDRLLALNRFMTVVGVVLVALSTLLLFTGQPRAERAASKSELVRTLAEPVRIAGSVPAGRNDPKRDIYLIVLDGHANARVLRDVLGDEDTVFADSLRVLGFVIPPDVRSNYVHTVVSMPSLLNFEHVTRLTQDAGLRSTDHSLPKYLVANSRAARFLKEQGYRYLFFPSAFWSLTEHSPLADEEFDARPGFSLLEELRGTEFRLAVVQSSLLRYVLPRDHSAPAHHLRSFAGLRKVPANAAPTFTFAHVLLPHIPYVFDSSCRPLDRPVTVDMEADTPAQRAGYMAQVRCVDSLVLELVTDLIRRSPTPPIILVVGDHGTRFNDTRFYMHPDRVSPAFVRERFGAFGAFHLPAGGDSLFRQPVTLVNVFRHVFRYYFNADLPVRPDDMYVSGDRPYHFYQVEDQIPTSQ